MPGAAVRRQAIAIYFLWLGGLMGLIALIGFIPAIAIFIFAYMHLGFREPAGGSAIYAGAIAVPVLGTVPQAAGGGMAAIAARRYLSRRCARRPWFHLNDERRSGGAMTGLYEHPPGQGHNRPPVEDKEGKCERWSKKRTFVRELSGTYSDVYKDLLEQPRVYSSRNHPWKGGPALYGKHVVSPQEANVVQSIETHIECYAPGAYGQKHGHLNSAVFFVLKGRGHDIHDGRRIDSKAGDVMIVECASVHQHFNDDPDNRGDPPGVQGKSSLFLFMHLLFQKIVSYPPNEATPGHEDFRPPKDL